MIIALSKATAEFPGVGWIRGDAAASEDLLEQINELRNRYDGVAAENASLKSQSDIALEGIADFESQFKVRFSYREWDTRQSTYVRKNGSTSFSWKEIFSAIGPSLIRPSAAGMISVCISRYARENRNTNVDIEVFESDQNTIKFQLVGATAFSKPTRPKQRAEGLRSLSSLLKKYAATSGNYDRKNLNYGQTSVICP